jgi:hypothetical protein
MAFFQTLVTGNNGVALTAFFTKISGDDPDPGGYLLDRNVSVYSKEIPLVGDYSVSLRADPFDEDDEYQPGYVRMIAGETCEPVSRQAELDESVAKVLSHTTRLLRRAT